MRREEGRERRRREGLLLESSSQKDESPLVRRCFLKERNRSLWLYLPPCGVVVGGSERW